MASLLLKSRIFASQTSANWLLAKNFCTAKDGPIKNDLALLKPEEADQRRRLQGYITVEGPSDISPITGIPEEHIKGRKCRIFIPPKNAMQSGTDNLAHWEMEFDNRERWENPCMGWTSSGDPLSCMSVQFSSKEDAIAFCEKNGWQWYVQEATAKPMRRKSYAEIYAWSKRTRASTK